MPIEIPRKLPSWALPLAGFLVVVSLVVLPILAFPYLPLVDLPNHTARLYIESLRNGPLLNYYRYELRLVPNLAADLAWLADGFVGDPVRFSQLLIAFYAVSLIAATMLLARQFHGRWTLWSAASGLFVYNACLYWGFQNYLISLPIALLGFSIWIATEHWRRLLRLPFFMLFGFGLFALHFYAFVDLGLLAFGHEIQRVMNAPRGKRGLDFVCRISMAIPFLVPTGWLAFQVLTGPPNLDGGGTHFGNIDTFVYGLASPAMAASLSLGLATRLVGLLVASFMVFLVAFAFRSGRVRLAVVPAALGPALTVLVFGFFIPHELNGVYRTNIRWPLVGVLVLIAGSDWRGLSRRGGVAITLIVLALLGGRAASFVSIARNYTADVGDFLTVTEQLPPGARLLPLRSPGHLRDARLWHITAYAVVRRQDFTPFLFQGVHALQVLPRWRPLTNAQLFPPDIRVTLITTPLPKAVNFMNCWPEKFTYAVLLDPDTKIAASMNMLREVARAGRFTLYRIAVPHPAPADCKRFENIQTDPGQPRG